PLERCRSGADRPVPPRLDGLRSTSSLDVRVDPPAFGCAPLRSLTRWLRSNCLHSTKRVASNGRLAYKFLDLDQKPAPLRQAPGRERDQPSPPRIMNKSAWPCRAEPYGPPQVPRVLLV